MGRTTTWTDHGVIWTIEGVMHTRDTLVFVEEAAKSPNLDRLKYFVWDVTGVTEHIDDEDDVELTAHYAASLEVYNRHIIGTLIANTPLMLALSEEYLKTMTENNTPWEMKIFNEREAGNRWIESKLSLTI